MSNGTTLGQQEADQLLIGLAQSPIPKGVVTLPKQNQGALPANLVKLQEQLKNNDPGVDAGYRSLFAPAALYEKLGIRKDVVDRAGLNKMVSTFKDTADAKFFRSLFTTICDNYRGSFIELNSINFYHGHVYFNPRAQDICIIFHAKEYPLGLKTDTGPEDEEDFFGNTPSLWGEERFRFNDPKTKYEIRNFLWSLKLNRLFVLFPKLIEKQPDAFLADPCKLFYTNDINDQVFGQAYAPLRQYYQEVMVEQNFVDDKPMHSLLMSVFDRLDAHTVQEAHFGNSLGDLNYFGSFPIWVDGLGAAQQDKLRDFIFTG